MYIVITILIVVICVLLAGIVLIQNPKGGGVNASFSGASQQIFGASKSSDVVEKSTWVLAVLFLILTLSSAAFIGKRQISTKEDKPKIEKTGVEDRINQVSTPVVPTAPTQTAPAQQTTQQPAANTAPVQASKPAATAPVK